MKHAPATPLPWRIEPAAQQKPRVSIKVAHAVLLSDHAPRMADVRLAQDAAYIAHAANAYPKLVEALKTELCACDEASAAHFQISSLLRELGELE